ncbi:MAG: hypothetical protein Q9162_006948 [Coniocarpon cinnabarinum]
MGLRFPRKEQIHEWCTDSEVTVNSTSHKISVANLGNKDEKKDSEACAAFNAIKGSVDEKMKDHTIHGIQLHRDGDGLMFTIAYGGNWVAPKKHELFPVPQGECKELRKEST